ncbi:protein CutA homolog isoform X2 [Aedes aegypti]|uniref:Uncharacterized protein n=1 Tax=Aedes aegypti TaxID=7159 RepID=A0A6I8TPA7_AEDAE|nr:protein CutA homolog isoform X2 [Aedes aegypti]
MILPAITIFTLLFSFTSIDVKGTFATAISEHDGDSSVIGGERPSSGMSSEKYEPGTHSIAYVTTPNANSAKELARKLVERKLAACVNIIPGLMSIYEWEGKINEDQEILLMIKTRTARVEELSKFVRENHPYSVAEVISVPIENGNPPYLEWLSKTVPEVAKK